MNFVKIIGVILILVGVIAIYDARIIVNKLFSFGDKNEGTIGLKISGFILTIIGCLMILIK